MSYVCTETHPITLDSGRMVGPGEQVTKLNEKHPHNAALIEEGSLIKVAPKQKQSSKKSLEASPPEQEESK